MILQVGGGDGELPVGASRNKVDDQLVKVRVLVINEYHGDTLNGKGTVF